jgi:uncharacterized repeat protein (TIGR01451 family)
MAMPILLMLQVFLVACGPVGTATPLPTATPKPVATLMVGKLVDMKKALPGDVLQYTLVVMNDQLRGDDPGTNVQLKDPLPDVLELVPGSLSVDATYDADTHTILWSGQVPRGLSVEVSFQARLTAAAASMPAVTNTVTVSDAFGRVRESSAVTPIETGQPSATPTATPAITSRDCSDVAPFAPGCLDQPRPSELASEVEFIGILPAGPVTVAAWSPDGTRVAYSVVNPDGWSGVEVRQAPEFGLLGRWEASYVSDLTWSPDGQAVLFVFDRGDTSSIGQARIGEADWRDLLLGDRALLAVSASKSFEEWLDDNVLVFGVPCGTGCKALYALDLATGRLSPLLSSQPSAGAFYASDYLFSSNHRWLAATSWGTGLPRTMVLEWPDPAEPVDLSALLDGRHTEAQSWTEDSLAVIAYPPGEPREWPMPPRPDLYVWDADVKVMRQVASGAARARFSPDGAQLGVLFVGEPQEVDGGWVQAEGSIPHLALLSWPEGELRSAQPASAEGLSDVVELWRLPTLTWSPDSKALALQEAEGSLAIRSQDGNAWPILKDRMVRWASWGGGILALLVDEALWLVRGLDQAPDVGLRTYVDDAWGIALDIPADWEVDHSQGAALHVLALDTAGTSQSVLTVSLVGAYDTLDATLSEVKRGAWGPHIQSVQPVQLGQFEALDVTLAAGDDRPSQVWLMVAPSGGAAVGIIPRADTALVEGVLNTLRAVPVPPGLVYRITTGFWKTTTEGPPVRLSERTDAVISPDGSKAVYWEADDMDAIDVWLVDLSSGEKRNLTQTPDRSESKLRWWAARPDVILFLSQQYEGEGKPRLGEGFLTVVGVDGSGYRVLDDQTLVGGVYGMPAPSPDGRTIAYGGGNTAWLYRWETGPEVFDPARYALTDAQGDLRIANPAWSPDGKRLAWVVHSASQFGIGVFNLDTQTAWLGHFYQPVGMDGFPPEAVWSPDGRWLAVVAMALDPQEGGLWVVRTDGRPEEHYLGQGSNPVWSPDGRWLAFAGAPQGGQWQPWLAEAETWNLRPLALPSDTYLADWISSPVQ